MPAGSQLRQLWPCRKCSTSPWTQEANHLLQVWPSLDGMCWRPGMEGLVALVDPGVAKDPDTEKLRSQGLIQYCFSLLTLSLPRLSSQSGDAQ